MMQIKEISQTSIEVAAKVWCDMHMQNVVMEEQAVLQIALIIDNIKRKQKLCLCCGKPCNTTNCYCTNHKFLTNECPE